LGALIAAGLILPIGTLVAANAPIVHVKAVVADGSVQLELEANGPFEYTTYRPSASLYVIDLSGVAAADGAGLHLVSSDLVESYRLISFVAGGKPEVRVEIQLKQGVEPRLQRKGKPDSDAAGVASCECRFAWPVSAFPGGCGSHSNGGEIF
jgi:hypothetical protein